MAPSSGHISVPKVINAFKHAISRTAQAIRAQLAQEGAAPQHLKIPIRIGHTHPLGSIRRSHSQFRKFSTSLRQAVIDTYPSLRANAPVRSQTSASRTFTFIKRSPGASSFASTLRPNLTGGALPRSAGGYGNIGGKRMFSSVPGSQAQVLHNVSAGMRAFWVEGKRGQFDGVDMVTGEKRFVAVGQKQAEAARNVYEARCAGQTRGTTLEFCLQPSLADFAHTKSNKASLNLNDAMTPLAADFAKSLGALAAVHLDLKRLSVLGDLSVSEPRPGWLAVRFPGCDGATVNSLCSELGVCGGVVREDESWGDDLAQDVKMALLFPTAPSEDQESYVDAYFYSIPQGSGHLSQTNPSYTADETLSPLGSIDKVVSPPQDIDEMSFPPRSRQSNSRLHGTQSMSYSQDIDRTLGRSEGISRGIDTDSICIMRFLAECDDRLTR